MVQVLCAFQYRPLEPLMTFDNETGLTGRCRFLDFSGIPVEARFCAGKGIAPEFKRLLLAGKNGEVVVDFADNKVTSGGWPIDRILPSGEVYKQLFLDLYHGRGTTLSLCLNIAEGEQVVRFLETTWRATQWIEQNGGFRRVPRRTGIWECGAA